MGRIPRTSMATKIGTMGIKILKDRNCFKRRTQSMLSTSSFCYLKCPISSFCQWHRNMKHRKLSIRITGLFKYSLMPGMEKRFIWAWEAAEICCFAGQPLAVIRIDHQKAQKNSTGDDT